MYLVLICITQTIFLISHQMLVFTLMVTIVFAQRSSLTLKTARVLVSADQFITYRKRFILYSVGQWWKVIHSRKYSWLEIFQWKTISIKLLDVTTMNQLNLSICLKSLVFAHQDKCPDKFQVWFFANSAPYYMDHIENKMQRLVLNIC